VIVDQRVWKTADGRLVADGDPEAAFLAHTVGEEVSDGLAKSSGLAELLGGAKAKPAAGNKMAGRPADKAASPSTSTGSGQSTGREKRT
jgi:hypothetical protein